MVVSGTHRGSNRSSAEKPSPPPGASNPPGASTPGSQKTARNSRRRLTTGTVADIEAMLPEVPTMKGPWNGPHALPDHENAPQKKARKRHQRIDDDTVKDVRKMIRSTGAVQFLEDRISARKGKGGPKKPRVTVEAVLVAMFLAAILNRPMLLTEFAEILFHCISPSMRRTLNLRKDAPRVRRTWRWRTSGIARRLDHWRPSSTKSAT